jgi:hypothetical protein
VTENENVILGVWVEANEIVERIVEYLSREATEIAERVDEPLSTETVCFWIETVFFWEEVNETSVV